MDFTSFFGDLSALFNFFYKQVPGQPYQPQVEVARSYCRQVKQGYHRTYSPRYYLSFVDEDDDKKKGGSDSPRVVVQMDTESSVIYQKKCLDYHFEKPVQVCDLFLTSSSCPAALAFLSAEELK